MRVIGIFFKEGKFIRINKQITFGRTIFLWTLELIDIVVFFKYIIMDMDKLTLIIKDRSRFKLFEPFEDSSHHHH